MVTRCLSIGSKCSRRRVTAGAVASVFAARNLCLRGGPDGGDGGKGGDVILRADEHADNLASLFYEPLIKAKKGRMVGESKCTVAARRRKS